MYLAFESRACPFEPSGTIFQVFESQFLHSRVGTKTPRAAGVLDILKGNDSPWKDFGTLPPTWWVKGREAEYGSPPPSSG